MPRDKTSWRLLRTIGLQIALLGVWWLILYQPSLLFLRGVAEIPFTFLLSRQSQPPLRVDPSGEWNFSIPVNAVVKDPKEGPGPKAVDSIEFAAPPENIAPFTTGWFVYAGLALSLPLSRQNIRRALLGMGIQTAVNALALFVYAEVNALGILESLHASPGAFYTWLLKYAYHIDYLVIPYAGPFLLLLLTHPWWWVEMTAAGTCEIPSKTPPASAKAFGAH